MNAVLQWLPRTRLGPIGLDLGAGGYRAAQTRSSAGQWIVERCLCVDSPTTLGPDGATATTLRRIREDARGAGFQRSAVVTAASASDTEFHLLDVPAGVLNRPSDEASEAVRWEVARGVNGTIDDYEIRHWLTPGASASGPSAVAVSVRRKVVMDWVEALHEVGWECRGVDTFATALARLGCLLRRPDPRTVWGLLDVGLAQSRLVLCVDEVAVLVRNVGPGGQAWTQQIAESLQVTPKTAEVQKRDHGIANAPTAPEANGAAGRDDAVGALLLGALRAELGQLAAEIKRSYEYVLTFHAQRQASDLFLVGGGAHLRNLPEFLAASLGIPVVRASAALGTHGCHLITPSTDADLFDSCALAIGLAAWGEHR